MVLHEARALLLIPGRDSILGHHQRHAVARELAEYFREPRRMNLPPERRKMPWRAVMICGAFRAEREEFSGCRPGTDDLPRVVIDPDEIQCLARVRTEQPKHGRVQRQIPRMRRESIGRARRIAGHDERRAVREAHHRVRTMPMQDRIGGKVCPAEIPHCLDRAQPAARAAGRPVAAHVGVLRVDGRLIDRQPVFHRSREASGDVIDEACERGDAVTRCPAPARSEPGGVREVMQRDDGLESAPAKRRDDVGVVCEL